MKLATLFSGGKDSCYATYLAKKQSYEISCLISIVSENKESYMFHTPSIEKTKKQAKVMKIPIVIQKTKGKKEDELKDLEKAIKKAIKEYKIEGVVTGAVGSTYQASRIQNICNKLKIECFNPLWQKNQIELLEELVKNKFEIVNPAGEGGEFETFVLNCPLFSRSLKIKEKEISGEKNSWKVEIEVE